jgi:hypothetical protein
MDIRARTSLVLAFLLGLAGGSGPAVAGPARPAKIERAEVLVIPLPAQDVPPPIQDQILASVARHLRDQFRLGAMAGRSVGRAIFGAETRGMEEAIERFRAKVREGRSAYDTIKIQRAIKVLGEARELGSLVGPELTEPDLLTQMHLYTGLSWLATGKAEQAAAEFRQAVTMGDELKLDPRKFPPDVVSAFEKSKRELRSGRPAQVEFLSKPAGASVFLDGRRLGVTPLKDHPVYPGYHFVRMELEGHAAWTLNLPDGVAPSSVRALLTPLWTGQPPEQLVEAAISTEPADESMLALLRLLSGFYKADALLLVSLSREDQAIHLGARLFVGQPESLTPARLFNLGSRPESFDKKLKGIVGTLKQLDGLRPAGRAPAPAVKPEPDEPTWAKPPTKVRKEPTRTVVGAREVAIPSEQPPVPPPEDDEDGAVWYESWWFWTIAGVLVVGGATVGALYGTGVLGGEGSWTLVVQPNQ